MILPSLRRRFELPYANFLLVDRRDRRRFLLVRVLQRLRTEASAADTVGVCESEVHSLDDGVDAGCVRGSMSDDEDPVAEVAT